MSVSAVGVNNASQVQSLQALAKPVQLSPEQKVGASTPDSVEISSEAKQLSKSEPSA